MGIRYKWNAIDDSPKCGMDFGVALQGFLELRFVWSLLGFAGVCLGLLVFARVYGDLSFFWGWAGLLGKLDFAGICSSLLGVCQFFVGGVGGGLLGGLDLARVCSSLLGLARVCCGLLGFLGVC